MTSDLRSYLTKTLSNWLEEDIPARMVGASLCSLP